MADADDWEWLVEDAFTITGRGVVVVGALRGPMPGSGTAVEVVSESHRTPAQVGGIEIMRVVQDLVVPDGWPILMGDPAGLLLTGVTKDEVPVGSVVRPDPQPPL